MADITLLLLITSLNPLLHPSPTVLPPTLESSAEIPRQTTLGTSGYPLYTQISSAYNIGARLILEGDSTIAFNKNDTNSPALMFKISENSIVDASFPAPASWKDVNGAGNYFDYNCNLNWLVIVNQDGNWGLSIPSDHPSGADTATISSPLTDSIFFVSTNNRVAAAAQLSDNRGHTYTSCGQGSTIAMSNENHH